MVRNSKIGNRLKLKVLHTPGHNHGESSLFLALLMGKGKARGNLHCGLPYFIGDVWEDLIWHRKLI